MGQPARPAPCLGCRRRRGGHPDVRPSSWLLTALDGVVLLGFWWLERERPPWWIKTVLGRRGIAGRRARGTSACSPSGLSCRGLYRSCSSASSSCSPASWPLLPRLSPTEVVPCP